MVTSRDTNKFKIAAIFAVTFLFSFLFLTAPTAHAATSSVRGIGWWGDTYGEVYFDCLDDKVGDRLDEDGNLYNLPLPRGFHFYSAPCSTLQHHVYLDTSNNFSGQAWNPTKGLISLSGTTTPPDGYGSTSSNCDNTCNASNNCWACYKNSDQGVYGWARVDTTGEWINLSPATTTPVKIQNCSATSVFPGYSIAPGDFAGFATSTLGDLSFNCQNDPGSGACTTRNYKVYINGLSVGSLSAPNYPYSQACSGSARGATLKWCVKSGIQTAYEIVVNSVNTLSTSTATCWSGVVPSDAAFQYNLPNGGCTLPGYGASYYWWLRLYDENGIPTQWYQYFGNTTSDTDGDADRFTNPANHTKTFTTYQHEFPTPYFTWQPYDNNNVLVGTTTTFDGLTSRYFSNASPNVSLVCSGANCSYLWTTSAPALFTPDNTGSTTIIFTQPSSSTVVSLRVTDAQNYYCSTSTIMNINYDLPVWREIKAK